MDKQKEREYKWGVVDILDRVYHNRHKPESANYRFQERFGRDIPRNYYKGWIAYRQLPEAQITEWLEAFPFNTKIGADAYIGRWLTTFGFQKNTLLTGISPSMISAQIDAMGKSGWFEVLEISQSAPPVISLLCQSSNYQSLPVSRQILVDDEIKEHLLDTLGIEFQLNTRLH